MVGIQSVKIRTSTIMDEFNFGKKKKRNHIVIVTEQQDEQQDNDDYTYDDLIKRCYTPAIRMSTDTNTTKLRLHPLVVARVGTRRTSLVNFADVCLQLHRSPKHVAQFFAVELGTTVSCNVQNSLIVRGRFTIRQFEAIITKYVGEYVKCNTCKSYNTTICKIDRILFKDCSNCKSRSSIVKSSLPKMSSHTM
jgi:translation initiation factor 2 subunit 2